MDATATHLPILEKMLEKHQYKKVLEFGCGLFSTKFFIDHGCDLISVEMQNEDWMHAVHSHYPKADIRLALGPDAWRELNLEGKYDMIFVDGHGDSRPECMEWAKDHTDLIIAHDTEHPYYRWWEADMSGFNVTEYKDTPPWTTVWERE